MVFNSLTFVVFFTVVLFVHHLPLSWWKRKVNLLLASYVFYAAWNPPFVLLLVIAAVVDFHLARWLAAAQSPLRRRGYLIVSVALNLGLLSYFKYGGFLLENFTAMLHALGVQYSPPKPNIILPLGISFYTFETISYLVDVYRKKIEPWPSFVDYALFLTFFPHLVAGPIVRAGDFLPQCERPHRATPDQMGWGLALMVIGLFQKIVLADGFFGPAADAVFDRAGRAGFFDAWVGTLAFSGQIFCDFAGYSTCGIGAALCLGFVLKDNFHFPYGAIGFSDFWQRWHISLSTWLRDYLYIPLGGNRHGTFKTYRNLMLTMLLGGLWHGASWRFVAWGGLHGSYLVGERLLAQRFGGKPIFRTWPAQVLLALLTYILVCIAWVFFRAQDFPTAFHMLTQMSLPKVDPNLLSLSEAAGVLVLTAMLVLVHWQLRDSSLESLVLRSPWWVRSAGLATALICVALAPGDDRAFIYFQF